MGIYGNNIRKENELERIKKFNKELNNYKYGCLYNGKITNDISDKKFAQIYRTISPQDFEKYKGGVCWDYAEYERYYFKKHFKNIKFRLIYIELADKNSSTHTFLIFKYKGKSYHFESSWYKYQGVHEYNNDDDLINDVLKNMTVNNKPTGYIITDYTDYIPEYKLSCIEYMNEMSNQKIVNKENFYIN